MTDRCVLSDLPVDACAHCRGESLPAGAVPEVRRGDPPMGFVFPLTVPARDQRTARDTRVRARRPKPLSSCRWTGEGWATREHTRDCRSTSCQGCKPCGKDHCAMRGSCPNHVDHGAGIVTCPHCVGEVRDILSELEVLAALMPVEAVFVGVESEAMNLAGPVASADNLDGLRRYDVTRGWCDFPLRPELYGEPDEQHPAAVLGRWELDLRAIYGPDVAASTTITGAIKYLKGLLAGPMPHEDMFAPFSRALVTCRAHLEEVLSDSRRPETGAPCPKCAENLDRDHKEAVRRHHAAVVEALKDGTETPGPLPDKGKAPRLTKQHAHWCENPKCEKEHDKSGAGDEWVCPDNQAHRFDEATYRLRVAGDYLARADRLTASQMSQQWDVKPSTLRTWAERGQVKRVGKDVNGRLLYDVASTRACIEREKVEA